ncbi:Gfo/Idh/MocA family oxidoreductase [Patescibacteria group bacterium]|nr:Gfo/Idh/MocA family oxidoreductase [Patescibacteria group bacterium]
MSNNNQFKTAVVGLGYQSHEDHLPALKNIQNIDLVAVCDKDKDKLSAFKKENKKIAVYNNIEKMLKKHQLDFAIVVLPHNEHYNVTKKLISNKIHILKEKPFAVNLKEGVEIMKLAQKNKIQIMTTLQRRYNPIYTTFFQLIDKIGTPFYIDIRYHFYVNNPHEGWRGIRQQAGGGCLIDMGYHMIDLLVWYFGLPEKVFAEFSCNAVCNVKYDAEDTISILFKYIKCLWGTMLISRVVPPKEEYFYIYGTHGIIKIKRGLIERLNSKGDVLESLTRQSSWPSAATDQIEYFLKVITGERKNITSPEFNFNHLAFIEACYRANNSNKYVNPHKLIKDVYEKQIGD